MAEILVIGTSPRDSALESALRVCTSCSVQAADGEPKWVTHDGDLTSQKRIALHREVRQYEVVIALPSLLRHTSDAISLVHRLRTDLYWEGRFLAVVTRDSRAEKLRESSFVGEPVEGTCFGEIPGHEVRSVPLRIPELLSILNESDDRVHSEYWHLKLLRSGRAAQLNRQIKKVTRVLNDPQVEGDGGCPCRDILASLEIIDWSLVARRGKGHALHNSVQSLLEEHKETEHLTTEAGSIIVKEAKRILAQSTFPFPSEE